MSETRVALFGLGEAGTCFARDIVASGATLRAFDPAGVATPMGVNRCGTPTEAVQGAELVLALVAASDASTAVRQAIDDIPQGAVYADASTGSSDLKAELAGIAGGRGLAFTDVALMGMVPGNGIRTPSVACGDGALRYRELMVPLGAVVKLLDGPPGRAADLKLMRSVVMKGLAALVVEALQAARRKGEAELVWGDIVSEITRMDEAMLRRLLRGTELHAARRLHEMEASQRLLEGIGIVPVMTRSTVAFLRAVPRDGVPQPPARDDASGAAS